MLHTDERIEEEDGMKVVKKATLASKNPTTDYPPVISFKAIEPQARPLKIGLCGESDTGKTYTSLIFAKEMCPKGKKWAFLDSEGGRVDDYSRDSRFGDYKWLCCNYLDRDRKYDPLLYIAAIQTAEREGYEGITIDTLSPFWLGILDIVQTYGEELAEKWRKDTPLTFNAWHGRRGGNTPFYQLMDAIVEAKLHVICTIRAKPEYLVQSGQVIATGDPQAVFRKGQHKFDFTLFGWLEKSKDRKHVSLVWEKTSSCEYLKGKIFTDPDEKLIKEILKWRNQ
jgi:hypothetical protein